jgi:Asp-tRNA(Asn)/Glu-tRNA(Gln) amidotransferase A subunit family amidase
MSPRKNSRTDIERVTQPQDELVSRRWFLERMAWVSSATAAGTLFSTRAAFASETGNGVNPIAFEADVDLEQVADLTELTISEAMTLIRSGRLTPAALVTAHVDRIEKLDGQYYQAYQARPTRAEALAQAQRAAADGTLRGIPLVPKDNFYTTDMLTQGNSLVYKGFQPSYDATSVALMRQAGGVIIGKAQMGNLAGGRANIIGTTTPTTRNAWTPNDVRFSPAGSSSGTGSAVAARLAMAGLGTETGGSVIGPGTAEGLTCIKPTFGRISLYGVIPLSYTRDTVGVMARNAMDAAILLQVLAKPDPKDPRTLGLPAPPDYVLAATPVGDATPRLRFPTRIGIWPGYLTQQGPEAEQRKAMVATLERLGATIVPEIKQPDDFALLTGDPLGNSHGDPTAFFIDELRKDVRNFSERLPRFLNGMLQSADTYVKVQQARLLLAQRIQTQLFNQCDVILGVGTGPFDGVGFPLMCMPFGFRTETNTGLPVPNGATFGAMPFGEERLLAIAAAYQAVTDFHKRRPADPVA